MFRFAGLYILTVVLAGLGSSVASAHVAHCEEDTIVAVGSEFAIHSLEVSTRIGTGKSLKQSKFGVATQASWYEWVNVESSQCCCDANKNICSPAPPIVLGTPWFPTSVESVDRVRLPLSDIMVGLLILPRLKPPIQLSKD